MTLLDYSNHNYYLPHPINYPFHPPHKLESLSYDDHQLPLETELLCFDPLPPSLFDFDFQLPLFTPPPPPSPPLQLDIDFDVDELIIPDNLPFNPFTDEDYPPPPLYLPEDNGNANDNYNDDRYFPFPKKYKLSIPSGFDGFYPENHGVSQCGSCCNSSNVVDIDNGGGKEMKGVSVQSKAARERRRKITEKTQEIGKLVPGGSKMNTAEMLQAAYNYVKFLQAQLGLLHFLHSNIPQKREKNANVRNFAILGSPLIQEKLYAKKKCLVPKDLLQILDQHFEYEDPSISNHILQLLHN